MEFTGYAGVAVALAVDLVNTRSPVSGRDELTGPDDLVSFLKAHRFSSLDRVGTREVDEVKRVRERLRAVFEAPDEGAAAAAINALLAASHTLPQLSDHDDEPWHLHFTLVDHPLPARVAGEAAMGLAVVIDQDGYDRLRVCEGDRCRDVFVDMSRNRSRRYCSPSVCGNRASVAAYRARRRETAS